MLNTSYTGFSGFIGAIRATPVIEGTSNQGAPYKEFNRSSFNDTEKN